VSLLQLADHVIFDPADTAGIIVDTRKGRYLSLNEVGTLMLQAALESATADETLTRLHEQIDASHDTLAAGLDLLTRQLRDHALLASPPGESA
jgi:hypothetical protein